MVLEGQEVPEKKQRMSVMGTDEVSESSLQIQRRVYRFLKKMVGPQFIWSDSGMPELFVLTGTKQMVKNPLLL